jgi:hypothetical protein
MPETSIATLQVTKRRKLLIALCDPTERLSAAAMIRTVTEGESDKDSSVVVPATRLADLIFALQDARDIAADKDYL